MQTEDILGLTWKADQSKVEVQSDAAQHTICLATLYTTKTSTALLSSRQRRLLVVHLARGRAALESGRILPVSHPRVSNCMHNSQRSTTARRYGDIESVILPTVMR